MAYEAFLERALSNLLFFCHLFAAVEGRGTHAAKKERGGDESREQCKLERSDYSSPMRWNFNFLPPLPPSSILCRLFCPPLPRLLYWIFGREGEKVNTFWRCLPLSSFIYPRRKIWFEERVQLAFVQTWKRRSILLFSLKRKREKSRSFHNFTAWKNWIT